MHQLKGGSQMIDTGVDAKDAVFVNMDAALSYVAERWGVQLTAGNHADLRLQHVPKGSFTLRQINQAAEAVGFGKTFDAVIAVILYAVTGAIHDCRTCPDYRTIACPLSDDYFE